MSGSLYQYTPYQGSGQPESPGQAFRSGFVGGQQIETNAMRMDEMRQLAQMRELQEQRAQQAEKRAQALEARTAAQFPLTMKQTALGVSRSQQLLPQEIRRGELTIQGLERTIAEQNAAIAALRAQVAPPMVTPGAAPPQAAPGVAVPGATPGFMAPVVVPAAPATPGRQSELRPSWMSPVPYARAPGAPMGVQMAQLGEVASDATPEEPADLTGRGAPVGMPERSISPPPTAAQPPLPTSAPVPGGYEAGLAPSITADVAASNAAIDNFLAGRSDAQLREIVANGTPSTIYGQRRGVTAGQAALAESARTLLERRASGAAPTPGAPAAAAPGAAAVSTEAAGLDPNLSDRGVFGPPRPEPQAPRQGGTTQTAADAAVSRGESPTMSYILEPLRIGSDQRRLTTEYAQLQRRYQTALAARDRAGVDQAIARMNEINQELTHLNGMTAITQFRNGDAAPLAGVLHEISGRRLSFQPRSDGTFNVFLDGQLSRQGVTRDEVETAARLEFDTRFRAQIQQQQTQRAALSLLRAQEEIRQNARVSAEGILEVIKAQVRAASPELDVQRITGADGQQMVVVVDKRTGQTVSGARIIQVPPPPGSARGAQPTFTIEPMSVGQR